MRTVARIWIRGTTAADRAGRGAALAVLATGLSLALTGLSGASAQPAPPPAPTAPAVQAPPPAPTPPPPPSVTAPPVPPAAAPPAATATPPAPATPDPAPAMAAPASPPATPPVAGAPPPDAASVLPTDEAIAAAGFGDEVTLAARPALVMTGKTTWDDLYGAFRTAIAQLKAVAAREGAEMTGPPMIRFVSSSDDAVDFEAILPVREAPRPAAAYAPARPGTTPAGQALRFVHHGGYDTMEQTYDEIANHLDERSIVAEDAFVEEYVRDPDKTPETSMAVFIYVFPKAR